MSTRPPADTLTGVEDVRGAPADAEGSAESDGWWARGLTLAERCTKVMGPVGGCTPVGDGSGTAPREGGSPVRSHGPLPSSPVTERARQRLRSWHEAHGLGESGQFAARLADLDLSEDDLLALLAEPSEALAARSDGPGWVEFTSQVFQEACHAATDRPACEPDGGPNGWADGFARILWPYLDVSNRLLLPATPVGGVDPLAVRTEFWRSLTNRLVRAAARTLVLELNTMRETGQLAGVTPHDRFTDFVQHLRDPTELARFLRRYPVLARVLAQLCEHAVAATAELLERFAADRSAIIHTFFAGTDPGPLVALETGAGDRHQRGRTVALLRFDSGARLVYKPRPLSAHRHFNELLEWLNGHDPELSFRTLTVLERPGYGWVEFVSPRECVDRASVERFYHRQGHLLALLYLLDGSDVHYENLIACADQPVLVDVETLFHPHLPPPEPVFADPAADALARSVYRTALLPQLLLGDNAVLDVSGLGGGDRDSELPVPVVAWQAPGTDEMRLVRRAACGTGAANRPRLNGVEVDPADFAGPLLAGFRAGYDLLACHREDLLRPDGPLQRFAQDEVRLVVRATRVYQTLLDESTHPDVLRDALDRDRLLDVLWAGSAGDRVRLRLVRHEHEELWRGDVPIFTFRPGRRDLWSGNGERLADVLDRVPLDLVSGKLRRMSIVDRKDQEWMIQATLATRLAHRGHETGEPNPAPYPASAPYPDRLLAAARGVADQILAHAFDDHHRINWLGLELLDDRYWAIMPLGAGLASGYSGVALFLAQLATLTGDTRYAAMARRALRPLPGLVERLAARTELARVVGCGGFAGFGGIAYALAQVGLLLDDQDAVELVGPVVRLANQTLDNGDDHGVHDGVAGCLAAMLAVHAMTAQVEARETAARAAARLLADGESGRRSGFAFGTAGVGWALLRYAAAAGNPQAGRRGRELLSRAVAATDGHSWCHGRPGAVLALLDVSADLTDDVRGLVSRTVRSVVRSGPLPNHSLCHGELGRLELVGAASRVVPAARTIQVGRAGMVLSAMERTGSCCGTPGQVATPGLLNGLAGIGHGLLRLAHPDRIPSALLLQAPTAQRSAARVA